MATVRLCGLVEFVKISMSLELRIATAYLCLEYCYHVGYQVFVYPPPFY